MMSRIWLLRLACLHFVVGTRKDSSLRSILTETRCIIHSWTLTKTVVKSSKWWIIKFIQTFALKPLLEMILPCWNGKHSWGHYGLQPAISWFNNFSWKCIFWNYLQFFIWFPLESVWMVLPKRLSLFIPHVYHTVATQTSIPIMR